MTLLFYGLAFRSRPSPGASISGKLKESMAPKYVGALLMVLGEGPAWTV
jgi:hypothetical protein